MKHLIKALAVFALLGTLGGTSAAWAADGKLSGKDLVLKDDAKCTECHDEGDGPKILHIGKTKHGTVADGRTPTCTSCHGDSAAHLKGGPAGTKERPKPDVVFGKKDEKKMIK